MSRRLLLVLPLLVACKKDAPEGKSGTAWSGTQTLTEDFTVAQGEVLEILPGTTVALGQDVVLTIEGELLARGTADAPILFTASGPELWGGLHFVDPSADATFENLDDYVGGSIIEHAILEKAQRAVVMTQASPYVHASTFRDNESPGNFDSEGGPALFIDDASYPRVRANTFENNFANPIGFGGAVFVRDSDPILQDNVFLHNESSYGGALYTELMAAPIVGGRFEGNETLSEGGAMSLLSSIAPVMNVEMTGNHAHGDGGGLHVCVTCYPHATPFIFDNVVTDNSCGVGRDEGAGGVGAAYLKAFEGNVLADNTDGDGNPSDFGWWHELDEGYPTWVSHPSIAANFWGTTDLGTIADTVHDGTDAAGLGQVSVEPVLRSAPRGPETRVTVSSRKLRYVDAGDEMPVFLSVYNPGPERVVTLSIARTEGNKTTAWNGDLDFPDASRQGNTWSLVLPENSVFFQKIEDGTYDGKGDGEGEWVAELTDAKGRTIGIPSVAPYAYGH